MLDHSTHKYWGELWIDEDGTVNFEYHIVDGNDFPAAREALIKFRNVIQTKLDNAERCPAYQPDEGIL